MATGSTGLSLRLKDHNQAHLLPLRREPFPLRWTVKDVPQKFWLHHMQLSQYLGISYLHLCFSSLHIIYCFYHILFGKRLDTYLFTPSRLLKTWSLCEQSSPDLLLFAVLSTYGACHPQTLLPSLFLRFQHPFLPTEFNLHSSKIKVILSLPCQEPLLLVVSNSTILNIFRSPEESIPVSYLPCVENPSAYVVAS